MALVFIAVLGAVNLRGVGDSIKLNVVLSCIEATGLLLVVAVGLWAFLGGRHADYSRIVPFTPRNREPGPPLAMGGDRGDDGDRVRRDPGKPLQDADRVARHRLRGIAVSGHALSGRPIQQYVVAAILIGSGVLLSLATQVFNRRRAQRALPIDEVAPVGA